MPTQTQHQPPLGDLETRQQMMPTQAQAPTGEERGRPRGEESAAGLGEKDHEKSSPGFGRAEREEGVRYAPWELRARRAEREQRDARRAKVAFEEAQRKAAEKRARVREEMDRETRERFRQRRQQMEEAKREAKRVHQAEEAARRAEMERARAAAERTNSARDQIAQKLEAHRRANAEERKKVFFMLSRGRGSGWRAV